MTRLVSKDLKNIDQRMMAYDRYFAGQTGKTLVEVAKTAAGLEGPGLQLNAAIVPVSCGEGLIEGFSYTEKSILSYAGIDTLVTEKEDIAGLQEAYLRKRQVVFMADDDAYIAVGTDCGVCADNGEATGHGYGEALISAIRHRGHQPEGKKVLVLGAGPVGKAAAGYTAAHGMIPYIYDPDHPKAQCAVEKIPGAFCLAEVPDYRSYTYLVDATTQGDFIGEEDVSQDTIIAAPGMPLGVTEEAMKIATVIHNPLELGTLTMYYQCVAGWVRRET